MYDIISALRFSATDGWVGNHRGTENNKADRLGSFAL